MKLLAAFARFSHFSNVLISTATVALCFQTAILLDWLYIPGWFYVLMFSNTVFQYGLHDLFTKQGTTNAKPKLSFWIRNRTYFVATVVAAAVVSGVLLFHLKKLQFGWLCILGLLTIAYSFPILPFPKMRRFKQNGVVKLLVLVLVWTISTTVLPATFIPYGFDEKFYWLLAVRFLFMLAICIPFDVRDDMTDVKTARHTLVGIFGENGCYRLSYLSLLIATALLFFSNRVGISLMFVAALGASTASTVWVVFYCSKHQFSSASYIMLDATMIIQTVLVCTAMLIP